MAMSRKHYREAAEVINGCMAVANASPEIVREAQRATLREVADGMAHMFKRDNSAFRYGQFLEACGIQE